MDSVIVNLDKVRVLMTKKKISEYGLSKLMNVSYSYVYRVMRGQRKAGQAFTDGLIRIGIEPNDIFLTQTLSKDNECAAD
ncbi:hypothetical protein SCACP_08700 [Sporomusa carbonis]|uniref:hypothetical protein n=1 Tax=Sporomusa carbonis TaxID=3076075 RepID=UPI003A7AA22B